MFSGLFPLTGQMLAQMIAVNIFVHPLIAKLALKIVVQGEMLLEKFFAGE